MRRTVYLRILARISTHANMVKKRIIKISCCALLLKYIYSEKATKFCKIFTLLLSYVVLVKSKVKISQQFVAFSERIRKIVSGEKEKIPLYTRTKANFENFTTCPFSLYFKV